MSDTEIRIREWLPARRDRGRVTTPDVAAANLGLDPRVVADAMNRMRRGGNIVADASGWHRGVRPC